MATMPALPDAAAKLLDFSQPFDVPLLDATVNAFYGAGSNEERVAAEAVLKAVQSHPEAWSRVDAVLEHSRSSQSKFFALQILEDAIKRRWGALPDEQRAGVRNFVSNMIISCASSSGDGKRMSRDERTFLHKLDVALVQILKQDWPHAWPSFVPDLCAASRASAPLCENSMVILKLLSEEVFDFSRGELTQAKTKELKQSLNTQFGAIHELCMFALAAGAGPLVNDDGSGGGGNANAQQPVSASLVRATLDTLHAYLSWVPLGYVFESDVVAALLRLFPVPAFRNAALKCLTEVAALSVGAERDAAFVSLATVFVNELAPMLPPLSMAPQREDEGGVAGSAGGASAAGQLLLGGAGGTSSSSSSNAVDHSRGLSAAYNSGSDEDQDFVQNLALFLTTFLRAHLRALEADPAARQPSSSSSGGGVGGVGGGGNINNDGGPLLKMLDLLASISFVPDEEVFKICLDYWHHFVPGVYAGATAAAAMASAAAVAGGTGGFGAGAVAAAPGGFGFSPAAAATPPQSTATTAAADFDARRLYARVLSRLRALMIARMAKPEEVIVVEDPESGAVVREAMKDTDTLARYKTMHETLVYLAHLDHDDTERQMHDALRRQLAAKNDWSWGGLNTLCWAVGSISGSMAEDQENRFLVTVIRDLLNLCEVTRGKDNKAVIAANIMYVVGQYPRFLRNHWKFLKTVVNKLFEFMHETHPGVQDMACETFLKICHKCRRKFVVQQLGEREPFVCELLSGLSGTIQDLEAHQVHMFYEAVGLMVGADADASRREAYLERLMAPPNSTWSAVVSSALSDSSSSSASSAALLEPERIKSVTNILQTNTSVCTSLGAPFAPQMARIFGDVLRVYSLYSSAADAAIADGGPHAARSAGVKSLRGAKRAALRLLETWVGACDDVAELSGRYVPAMAEPVLGAYRGARSPESRDAEALALYAAVVSKLRSAAAAEVVPRCFDAVFGPTLDMITANFEDFPEHRLQFFALLRSVAGAAFGALFGLGAAQLKLLVDAVVWAFRHTERNVAETGLNLLLDLLQAFERSPAAAQFYQTYYMHLVREIFAVMTDTFHKPGFKLHARILHHLFGLARPAAEGGLPAPLWEGPGAEALAAAAAAAAASGSGSVVGAVDPSTGAPWTNNADFVSASVSSLLSTSFPNLRPTQVEACCRGMFALRDFGAFKEHLRDFLVQTKSFASQDNADLFAEEASRAAEAEAARLAAIPGMANPHTGAVVAGPTPGGVGGGGVNGSMGE